MSKDQSKGTFIVRVDGYERGTWHGRVVWAEENRAEHFRSALELFKMIDRALEQGYVQSHEDDEEAVVG